MKREYEVVFLPSGKCSICGTKRGGCDCWTKCDQPGCLWFYRKGMECANASHAKRKPSP